MRPMHPWAEVVQMARRMLREVKNGFQLVVRWLCTLRWSYEVILSVIDGA